ncbi:MAG: benzoate-CoA ligase family protein [Geobacteraceae bacterium]|nr:benzoate-CoA ligase family protein [Geobacteraceae bacterium]
MNDVNAAFELLERNLERHPDKAAYLCGERSLSYGELARSSRRFALLLRERGIAPDERALIMLPDGLAFPVAFLGCLLAGVTAVVAGTALTREQFEHILDDSGSCLLVTDPRLPSPLPPEEIRVGILACDDSDCFKPPDGCDGEFAADVPPADRIAYMQYSSGSTGAPKGIPHCHRDLLIPCDLVGREILGLDEQDRIFSASKFSFAYGLINSMAFPLFFGATVILHGGKPDATSILELMRVHRPTVFFSVPTVYSQLILSCGDERLELPLRLCYSAGEALPAAISREWLRLTGLELLDGIGSTEMTYIYISNRPGRARPGSAGQVVPGYQIRLVDEDERPVPSGTVGTLLVKGPTMSPYYWNLPDKSRETMLPDGFLRSGDLFVEQDGFYYHQGRNDDMIKAGGQMVSPLPVEEALASHPCVAECAVVAVAVGGLVRPGAFVIASPGVQGNPALARRLRAHLLERLPEYMCPVRFTFVDELPRTSTGKIQRFRLREQTQPKGA